MAYAKKTCNICGYIDIQPRMVKKPKKIQIATGKRGLSIREVFGLFAGVKESGKSVRKWLYAPNKRVYDTTRMVWMCEKCTGIKTDYSRALEAEAKQAESSGPDRNRAKDAAKVAKELEAYLSSQKNRREKLNSRLVIIRKALAENLLEKRELFSEIIEIYNQRSAALFTESLEKIRSPVNFPELTTAIDKIFDDESIEGSEKQTLLPVKELVENEAFLTKQLKYACEADPFYKNGVKLRLLVLSDSRKFIKQSNVLFPQIESGRMVRVFRALAWIWFIFFMIVITLVTIQQFDSSETVASTVAAFVLAVLLLSPPLLLLKYVKSKIVVELSQLKVAYDLLRNSIKSEGAEIFRMVSSDSLEEYKSMSLSDAKINKFTDNRNEYFRLSSAIETFESDLREISSQLLEIKVALEK